MIFFSIFVFLFLYFLFKSSKSKKQKPQSWSTRKGSAKDFYDLPESFVVVDTETTGLDSINDRIVEIAAIKVIRGSDAQATYQALVKIDIGIPEYVTKIHGITNEMLEKDGIPLENALAEFKDFIGGMPVVAYNAPFDKNFINNSAKRIGMKNIIKRPICALKLARKIWPGLKSYKLSELAKMGKLSCEGTHRALHDCKLTMIVYSAALKAVN